MVVEDDAPKWRPSHSLPELERKPPPASFIFDLGDLVCESLNPCTIGGAYRSDLTNQRIRHLGGTGPSRL